MRRKLLLLGKTSLLKQRISIITSLILAVLTLGNFFLKTSTIIDDLTVGQKNAENVTVADTTKTTSIMKVIGSGGSCNDKNISYCLNNHFQSSAHQGKKYSRCYYVSYNHWDNDDDGHSNEEDIDVYDEEDRENEYERENA